MKKIIKLVLKYKFVLLVLFLSVPAVINLANYGIPPTHDGEYHVLRFQQFYRALSDGDLYPRWAPDFNNGYGIPLFNYVYPFPNYVAALLHLLGFGFIESFKLNMALASFVGAIFFYLWTKKNWGEVGGVVGAVFYTFAPYHFLDIYVRGSVGEVWALAFAPALYWVSLKYFESKKEIYFCLTSIFLALITFSHNILAVIFFAFFIVYSFFHIFNTKKEKGKEIINLFIAIVIGLGLSSIFWLPAILETQFVHGLQVFDPTQHFPQVLKLIYSSWGYGFSGNNVTDQMSFQIGIANVFVVFLSLIGLYFSKNKAATFFLICLFATIFLMTPFSAFIWKNIPGISYIQFPWRLLSLVILIISFMAAFLVSDNVIKNKNRRILLALALIIVCLSLNLGYAKAPFYHPRDDSHYLTRDNFTKGTNSPGDVFNTKWLSEPPLEKSKKFEILNGQGEIEVKNIKSSTYSFLINLETDSIIGINTAYFPGWSAYIDGLKVEVINQKGIITLVVPKGRHFINVRFEGSNVRKISEFIFIASLVLLLLIYSRRIAIIK